MLALAPHPDDVELCCGGLIAKMSMKGYSIGIIDLTRGEMGTEGTAEIRVQEAASAAEILGVKIRENMDFGDCKLSSSFEQSKKLADVIRRYRPSLLLAPYGDEQHPDHAIARELVDKATFLAKLVKVETNHEAHNVGRVAYYMLHKGFTPSFLVDVTESYDKKLESIKAYKAQMSLLLGIEGRLQAVELRDRFYGSEIGVKYAEAFLCNAPLKIDDPVALLR